LLKKIRFVEKFEGKKKKKRKSFLHKKRQKQTMSTASGAVSKSTSLPMNAMQFRKRRRSVNHDQMVSQVETWLDSVGACDGKIDVPKIEAVDEMPTSGVTTS